MANQKSDLSRAFSEDGALKTHVGGQALLEGIMMRGKFNWAAAVRTPDGGMYLEEHDLASGKKKNKWMTWPLVRGCVALVESLGLGYKALEVAADHAFDRYDMSYIAYVEEGVDPVNATPEERMRAAGWKEADINRELSRLAEEGEGPKEESASPSVERGGFSKPDEQFYREMLVDALEKGDVMEGGDGEGAPIEGGSVEDGLAEAERKFSWKRDFGNPDEMIDALAAQRTLEVVSETEEPAKVKPAKASDSDGLSKGIMSVSMVLGLVLGIALFIVAPAVVTNLIVGEYDSNMVLWNVVDGILRVAIFVFYLWLIGRMKDIKRMFAYHGAEHKTIHCYEHGLELTPENCRSFPRLHVRCGTAFLIMVMILAILVYTIVPVNALISAWGVPDGAPKLILVILVRIVFMPVIAGIAYEINVKWAGTHPDNPLVKVILWPGLQMQYLTTNEPDDAMIECAIAATKLILEREEREAAAA